MKMFKEYTSKKDSTVVAVSTGEANGKITLLMPDNTNKPVSESTLKRWWTESGEISEADVLTRLTGKKVTKKDLDKAAAKSDKKKNEPKSTAKPKAPAKTKEQKEADKKAKEAEKAKKAAERKAKADAKKNEPKPFKVRGSVVEAVKAIVETLDEVEVADGYNHEVIVVKGVRKALFTGGALCLKVKTAEELEIAHEVKGYNHPFKARVTIEANDLKALEAALTTVIKKL